MAKSDFAVVSLHTATPLQSALMSLDSQISDALLFVLYFSFFTPSCQCRRCLTGSETRLYSWRRCSIFSIVFFWCSWTHPVEASVWFKMFDVLLISRRSPCFAGSWKSCQKWRYTSWCLQYLNPVQQMLFAISSLNFDKLASGRGYHYGEVAVQ